MWKIKCEVMLAYLQISAFENLVKTRIDDFFLFTDRWRRVISLTEVNFNDDLRDKINKR